MSHDLQSQKEEIGKRLSATRQALNLDQGAFAKKAGLAPNTYNQYEKGERVPKVEQAISLCETYNITLDWIYRGDPSGLNYDVALKIQAVRRAR